MVFWCGTEQNMREYEMMSKIILIFFSVANFSFFFIYFDIIWNYYWKILYFAVVVVVVLWAKHTVDMIVDLHYMFACFETGTYKKKKQKNKNEHHTYWIFPISLLLSGLKIVHFLSKIKKENTLVLLVLILWYERLIHMLQLFYQFSSAFLGERSILVKVEMENKFWHKNQNININIYILRFNIENWYTIYLCTYLCTSL